MYVYKSLGVPHTSIFFQYSPNIFPSPTFAYVHPFQTSKCHNYITLYATKCFLQVYGLFPFKHVGPPPQMISSYSPLAFPMWGSIKSTAT